MKNWNLSIMRYLRAALAVVFFLFLFLDCGHEISWASNLSEDSVLSRRQKQRMGIKELETCSWLVTYKKRIYDLSPLTRKHLDRDLDGDIQGVIRRVPEAAEHLNEISKNNRDMKVHTGIATLALASFIGLQISHSASKTKSISREYVTLNLLSLLIFARAAYAGWELKEDSKEELLKSVQSFNRKSEDPILPYQGGAL